VSGPERSGFRGERSLHRFRQRASHGLGGAGVLLDHAAVALGARVGDDDAVVGRADLAEALLKSVFSALLKERPDDMAFFDERVEKGIVAKLQGIIDSQFARMDYGEAISILERAKEKFEFPVKWGVDLQSEHERFLTEKHAKKPVIVLNYPKAIKAFYMRQNDDGQTVAAMDVLAPGIGEIIGGSQREERLERLDERMDQIGIDKESLGWYRDLRRYGTVPHSGFGLGFERTVSYATGLSNVRDAIPFPRTPGNARY